MFALTDFETNLVFRLFSDVAGGCRNVTARQWLSFCQRKAGGKKLFHSADKRRNNESSLQLAVGNTEN